MTAAEITLGAVVCALWAVFLILSAIGTVVTHKDAKKKAAELHMVALRPISSAFALTS